MRPTKAKVLLKTARPAFLLLTPCCLSVAFAFAISEGNAINLVDLVLMVAGALAAHISVNMLNEYQDFKSGLDFNTTRTAFSGGSGALPASPQYADSVHHGGLLFLLFTASIGLYFLFTAGAAGLLPIGSAGIALVYFYSTQITRRPLLCLLAPGLGFGPCMILGAYYILSGHYNLAVLLTSLIIMFTASNVLLLNQFPDLEPDRSVGRAHLPIMIGRNRAAWMYLAFLAMAYALLATLVFANMLPTYSLGGFFTLVLAIPASVRIRRYYDTVPKLVPAMALNVGLALSLPVLISLGMLWEYYNKT